MAKKYCCERFANCINEGEIVHADDNDETEWYIPNWYHLYYCPFCGAFIQASGFQHYDDSQTQIPNTRAIGIFELADDYVKSGVKLPVPNHDISSVRYYLYCHGIELGLKSFLVSQGATDKILRKIGHDLIRALKAALCYDLLAFEDKDLELLEWLNSYYKDKEFEYLFVGSKSYPLPEVVQEFAERLLVKIKPIIDQSVHSYIAQEKAQQ